MFPVEFSEPVSKDWSRAGIYGENEAEECVVMIARTRVMAESLGIVEECLAKGIVGEERG